ncbi:hypothetical protein SACS_1178 [Parasaccharibacter apium]|uniref:Uncharacterized protein n=1 Tax=Parasaccharibacter apium TaxID=1510841 RepID=A0A7U7J199_9PROT|nr:hypothetical protein SACS_1178 [Parasaccharibacter apium]
MFYIVLYFILEVIIRKYKGLFIFFMGIITYNQTIHIEL